MTTIDPILLAFVKAREGCETNLGNGTFAAYWDPAGEVWTIGYGTTGQGIIDGLVWTQAQCDAALEIKLVRAREELLALTPPTVVWPTGALDALTDFVYNEGSGNYASSTVRKCVDVNDWAGVKTHLLDWEYAGGKKLAGLVTRREDEAAMIQSTP
jgi:lysozyme